MKKFLLKTVVPAVMGFSLIFAGCSADDGGSGGSSAVLSAVTLTAEGNVTSVSASDSVKLTATVIGENLSNSEIRYVWTIADGDDYASLDGELTSTAKSLTAEKTLTVNNSTTSEQPVKVTVRVFLGSTEKESSIELKIAAKETSSSGESSETESGSDSSDSSSSDSGSSGTDSGSSSSGTESSGTDSGSSSSGSESGSTESTETESGSVSIEVNIDGSVSCKKCGKTYDFKTQAENCEHYRCETCGSVYYSQEDADDCTAHITVIFTEAEGAADANETVTKVIKSGTTVVAPAWEKEGFTLTWVTESGSEYDFDDPLSVAEGETEKTVTFTAKWETTYTVTFKDESGTNADETAEVISGETVDSVPDWTREHYTLTDWTSSVEGLTVESAITKDVTFTAVWVEWSKCSVCGEYYETEEEASACSKTVDCPAAETVTVTFIDEVNGNETVTAKIFKNASAKSKAPVWTKDGYTLSWTPDFTEIEEDTTYTAVWSEAESQWKGTLNLTTSGTTTSDAGTDLTANFKTAETITLESNGVKQVFNIAKSSSNMQIDKNGLKFQAADTALTFTTADITKLTVVFYVSSDTRSIVLEGPDGLTVTYLGKTSVTSDSESVTGSVSGNLGTAVIENAPAGEYKIYAAGKYTVYTQSITIE